MTFRVLGILVTLYGLVQLVYARWFFERRRRRNDHASFLTFDARGVSLSTTRIWAIMTFVLGIGVLIGSSRLGS